MRAAIYARVSTGDGRQDTDNQLAQLGEFAKEQNWEIAGESIDNDSGGRSDRVEFRRMLKDASQRKFDVVLFWALDRFTREGVLETLKYLDQLTIYGVGRSFTEPYLDSCGLFKDAIIAILGTVAKQDRVRICERVRAGLNRAMAQGTRSGRPIGRPKVGFRRDEAVELPPPGFRGGKLQSD